MATTNTWQNLIEKYLSNTISKQELDELLQMADKQKDFEGLAVVLKNHWEKAKEIREDDNAHWDQKFEEMMKEIRTSAPIIQMHQNKKRGWLYRTIAAAVVVAVIAGGAYIYLTEKPHQKTAQITPGRQSDVAPGGNKAILTLADGSAIALDSAANGAIAQQGNTRIIKLDSGQLAYNSELSTVNGGQLTVQYNTVSTPRGGQYQIVLADGSKVWLNAASSLKYPTVFKGNERNVELTGEAYFEVAHNAAMPFHVKVNNMTVEVLGTHFNVMAYGDEDAIKTTLLEGSVRVIAPSPSERAGGEVVIKPGQQAQLDKQGNLKLIKDADVDEAVAWKEGRFQFNSTNITEVMREVSRWYDVDVEYENDVSGLDFSGIISRKENASKVLSVLEATGTIDFKIEGNKIIVSKK